MAIGDGYVSSYKLGRERHSSSSSMTTMRIAVAGTGGLALLIARTIAEETSHPVVFLTRIEQHRLALTTAGFQVTLVDYNSNSSLAFALRGIDTVISTVGGSNQIALIHAAVRERVRRFVPAEFEGVPQPQAITPLEQSRLDARRLLQQYANHIRSTIFVCGIFYERFHPGGLQASRIGSFSCIERQGDYMINYQNMTADLVSNANGAHVSICMTAARDVARFVTRALDMPEWPAHLFMRGQRVTVQNLVQRIQTLCGRRFDQVRHLTPQQIRQSLNLNHATNPRNQSRICAMLRTAEGHYDYPQASLNQLFPDVDPQNFDTWFRSTWAQQG